MIASQMQSQLVNAGEPDQTHSICTVLLKATFE